MKSRLLLPVLFLSLMVPAWLPAEEPPKASPAPPPPPDETTLIVDLRTSLPGLFQYGTWDGRTAAMKSGLAVLGAKGAQGSGGFGRAIEPAMSFDQVAYVEVAFGVVPGNEVPEFTIALNDADGTQYTARVRIDQVVPGQPVWMRVRRDDFKYNGVEPGKDSLFDWSSVARWHLQGDWKTSKPFQVIFIALRTRK